MAMSPREIAESNYVTGVDQSDVAAYLVNAIDTAREFHVSAEQTAEEFLALVEETSHKKLHTLIRAAKRARGKILRRDEEPGNIEDANDTLRDAVARAEA